MEMGRYFVVVARVDVATHSEVGDFHAEIVTDQAVATGQIAVDEVLRREVSHSVGDLLGDAMQIFLFEVVR